jgi:hypothetical protein
MTLVHDLLFNSKVLIWRKSSNWTRLYCLLAVENEIYYIQLPSGLTSFKSISIKPYFWSKDTHNTELDELEVPLSTLEIPLFTLEAP